MRTMPTCMLAAPQHAWLHRMIALFSVARSLSLPRGSRNNKTGCMGMLLLVLCLWMVCARRGIAPVQRQACEETLSKQESILSIRHHRMKIQTWRLARSMPMQAEYACAMVAACLTPQRRHGDRIITPTQQSAHASQPRTCVCLVQKDIKESHNKINKSIA